MTLVGISLALIVLGALVGFLMGAHILNDKPISAVLPLAHGALLAAGLIVLIVACVTYAVPIQAKIALGVFLVAALGGLYLLSFHLRKQPHPRLVLLAHAALAAIGAVLMIMAIADSGTL